jgi:redox-sensitive bicupin YhaK (pirin superfamily)
MKIRRSEERGHFDFGWLETYHSFSFGDYFDRNHMHFSDLRVINHDFIAPSTGFPNHPHKDMEIITYVLNGVVEHQDSMGNKTQIRAGEIQTMSAGTGIFHSEYNPSSTEVLELIQIWVMPKSKGGNPGYAQKKFDLTERNNYFLKIISGQKDQSAMPINQDAEIYASVIQPSKQISFPKNQSKKYWIQVVQGKILIEGQKLQKGDAISFDESDQINIINFESTEAAELLLFELQ